jgi:hypothetical protein
MIKAPKVIFHMLCSNLQIQIPSSSSSFVLNNNGNTTTSNGNINSNSNSNHQVTEKKEKKKAMCVGAYCCDPNYERNGIATQVHTAALQLMTPDIIIMRTVNRSILRLLRRTSPKNSRLFPNDCNNNNNNSNSNNSQEDWQLARHIAQQAVDQWEQLHKDRHCYDKETMVFRGVYDIVNEKVFAPSAVDTPFKQRKDKDETTNHNYEQKATTKDDDHNEDVFVRPGDAQLRVMILYEL